VDAPQAAPAIREQFLKLCRDILAPLVRADGGEMYVVSVSADSVHIHLSGACSGCPGAAFTREHVIEPLIESAMPKIRVVLTTGIKPPNGAVRIESV
jgi:Fe-S cluster biogenesis protein NfuA